MTNRFTEAARRARDITNKQLATEISALTTFNREQFQELFPLKQDKQAFLELMEQVAAETSEDEKLAYLRDNLKSAGLVALKILKVLI